MGCAGGSSGHRHDRCTLEDQVAYHCSPVRPGDSHHQATAKWSLCCCFLRYVPWFKCPNICMTENKAIPPDRAGCRPQRLLLWFLQLQGEDVLQTCPKSWTPSFLCCTFWDSSRVPHVPPQSFWLWAEWDHFMFSEILTVAVPLPCAAYTGSLWDHASSRDVVPRCPGHLWGLSSPEERIISHISQAMLLFTYLGSIFTL